MNRSFRNVAFVFFIGFGTAYLSADFMINHGNSQSPTLQTIYQTFDMPFYFSAGMYGLSALFLHLKKRNDIPLLKPVFWGLAIAWTILLIYLNLGFESLL